MPFSCFPEFHLLSAALLLRASQSVHVVDIRENTCPTERGTAQKLGLSGPPQRNLSPRENAAGTANRASHLRVMGRRCPFKGPINLMHTRLGVLGYQRASFGSEERCRSLFDSGWSAGTPPSQNVCHYPTFPVPTPNSCR
jgi:hypothetical protein